MRRELLLFVLAVLLYGLVNFTSAEVITISSTEIWDGREQHGITPYGSGTSFDPYVYDIPDGMTFTSSGVIKMNDKCVEFNFTAGTGGLEMAAGSYFDLTGSTRLSDPGECCIILGTHSLTGAGDFKTVDISKDSMDVIIGGANDVSVNSFYMRTDDAFAGTAYIHVDGSVDIGSIDTQDQAAGGNNGGDVTICGSDITIGDIDTRSLRTASSDRTSGSVLLEARDYWSANMLSNDVNLSGTVNTDSPVGTDGDVSMSGVVVILESSSNITQGSGLLDISAGVEQYGRTADDLFIDNSGGGYSAAHDVPWIIWGPEVSFETASSGDFETVSPVILTVVLYEAPMDQTVTVEYAVSGGTADGNGVDYTLDAGMLSLDAGDPNRTIEVTIVDDGIGEEDETVEVTLFNVVSADLGANVQHTYTIIDPRPFVEFDAESSHGRENTSPAEIPVSLSWASAEAATVDYTVNGGTATRNTDYTLADGTLTFDPCQTTQNIAVDIIDDDSEEGNETIVLALSNPTGNSRLGDNTQHTFTISEQIPLLRGAFYFRADSDPSARVGPHPDVMVRLGLGEDKLIFRRDKGYSPVWYGEDCSEQDLPTEVARSNCENNVNPFSRVSIIETNPARVIVHWRYARDCSNVNLTGWVDECFTLYPDGVCIRSIKNAAGTTFEQWNSMAPDIERMQLLPEGIDTLPASWLNPADLSINSGDYTYEGFNEERRCYELKCNVTSDPSALNLTLDTSGGKSIHDPAIVLKNWGDADAEVTVTGSRPATRYIGYADDMYGDHLVVWLGVETTSSIDISITPRGGSDFGYDFDVNVPPLPMGSPEPGPFGAYYTNLKFNNKFDEYWRVGDHTDVVVQFDNNAHRFVFWRGTNYGPHWVSDTNETLYSNWYGTQFVERRASEWGENGCCAEPMQDWDCRYAHARIISSNPARAIVQWRYASCDPDYDIVRDGSGDVWGDWDEEYFTIYPDAISVRK
ncbi:MAG: Calx-beta domain-containing protein, partial [Planctomycetota bacterium]